MFIAFALFIAIYVLAIAISKIERIPLTVALLFLTAIIALLSLPLWIAHPYAMVFLCTYIPFGFHQILCSIIGGTYATTMFHPGLGSAIYISIVFIVSLALSVYLWRTLHSYIATKKILLFASLSILFVDTYVFFYMGRSYLFPASLLLKLPDTLYLLLVLSIELNIFFLGTLSLIPILCRDIDGYQLGKLSLTALRLYIPFIAFVYLAMGKAASGGKADGIPGLIAMLLVILALTLIHRFSQHRYIYVARSRAIPFVAIVAILILGIATIIEGYTHRFNPEVYVAQGIYLVEEKHINLTIDSHRLEIEISPSYNIAIEIKNRSMDIYLVKPRGADICREIEFYVDPENICSKTMKVCFNDDKVLYCRIDLEKIVEKLEEQVKQSPRMSYTYVYICTIHTYVLIPVSTDPSKPSIFSLRHIEKHNLFYTSIEIKLKDIP